jgi:GNAT superfamily N-acetyltransferase
VRASFFLQSWAEQRGILTNGILSQDATVLQLYPMTKASLLQPVVALSFWKNNISVPTWTDYWFGGQTRLIDPVPPQRPLANVYIRKAIPQDLEQLPEFWSRWYSTKAARCLVPVDHIDRLAQGDILVCLKGNEVIGTLVRRWLTGLHMREVRWPKAGIIDYFCIHPAHRKKGIGRALLTFLHNYTLFTEKMIQPHLMLWEGLQPTIPPASIGLFLHRKCTGGNTQATQIPFDPVLWRQMQRGKDIWNEGGAQGETSLWSVGGNQIAVWNTFHRSVPEGLLIGIIVGGDTEATAFSNSSGHPFGILLVPGLTLDGWTIDSPYQWISYNTQMNFISYQFPGILL